MLIIKVFMNEEQIDEIRIWRKEHKYDDYYKYAVGGLNRQILHKRSDGYKPLLIKALELLIKKEADNK